MKNEIIHVNKSLNICVARISALCENKRIMEVDIILSNEYIPFTINDTVDGKLVIKSPNKEKYSEINIMLYGGIYLQNYFDIEPDNYLLSIVKEGKNISKKGTVNSGRVEFYFYFDLKPNQQNELFDTFHGSSFGVYYFLLYEIKRGIYSSSILGKLEVSVIKPGIPHEISTYPLQFYLHNNNKLENDNNSKFIMATLARPSFNIKEGIFGTIIVKENPTKLINIKVVLNRLESLYYANYDLEKNTTFPEFNLVEGDPVRNVEIFFRYYMPSELFASTCSIPGFYSIKYFLTFKAAIHSDSILAFRDIPVTIYYK